MSIRHVLQAFGTVFAAELPDKTMVATILLVTRYRRPLPVWIGAVAAFTVHVVAAVAAGKAISLLPKEPVRIVVAALFLIGAVVLFRAARVPVEEAEVAIDVGVRASNRTAIVGSFGLIILAEWGDLTQLATASLAARSGEPVSVGVGALAALATVAAIAVTVGRRLVSRVDLHVINYVGAAVFAALATWTIVELVA